MIKISPVNSTDTFQFKTFDDLNNFLKLVRPLKSFIRQSFHIWIEIDSFSEISATFEMQESYDFPGGVYDQIRQFVTDVIVSDDPNIDESWQEEAEMQLDFLNELDVAPLFQSSMSILTCIRNYFLN